MSETQTQVLVIGPPRSGTTALRMALNDHPDALIMGELIPVSILNPVKLMRFHENEAVDTPSDVLFRERMEDPVAFLDKYCLRCPRPVTGFKLLYNQILSPEFPEVFVELIRRPNLKIVKTWRRNLPARFRSLALKLMDSRRPYFDQLQPHFSTSFIARDCRSIIAARIMVEHLIDGVPAIEVCQEDLAAGSQKELARVQDFLGLAPKQLEIIRPEPREEDEVTRQLDALIADRALDPYRNHPGT